MSLPKNRQFLKEDIFLINQRKLILFFKILRLEQVYQLFLEVFFLHLLQQFYLSIQVKPSRVIDFND